MDDLAQTSLRVRAAFSSAVQTSAASLWVLTLQLTTCRVHMSITLAKQHHPSSLSRWVLSATPI